MIAIFGTIAALYVIILIVLYFAYQKVKPFKPTYENPTSRFTIIVPFRNEAKNIEALLGSLGSMNYLDAERTRYQNNRNWFV